MATASVDPVPPFREDGQDDREDEALVAQAQAGSRDALEALVWRHQGFLYNLAVRFLYHTEDAEDATQEILIKVLTKLRRASGRSSRARSSAAASSSRGRL